MADDRVAKSSDSAAKKSHTHIHTHTRVDIDVVIHVDYGIDVAIIAGHTDFLLFLIKMMSK